MTRGDWMPTSDELALQIQSIEAEASNLRRLCDEARAREQAKADAIAAAHLAEQELIAPTPVEPFIEAETPKTFIAYAFTRQDGSGGMEMIFLNTIYTIQYQAEIEKLCELLSERHDGAKVVLLNWKSLKS